MVSIASVFQEEIQRNFRGHLPPEAIKIIIVMADQMMQMEKSINSQQRIIEKMMQFMTLSQTHHKQLERELRLHNKEFDNGPITEAVEDPEGSVN